MSEIVCETINLNKKYKDVQVLRNINIKIKQGEIFGLIGENGAGKTTLIRILTGLARSTGGEVRLFGKSKEKELSFCRSRIGCIVEGPALYLDMTAKQNLEVQRIQKGIPDRKNINEVLSIVELEDTGNKKVKNFSLGMKQRLGLAIALLGEPELLILDEPVNGLDPTGIKELRELLIKLNKEKGITIIISSHILSELHKLATSYGIIHKGKLVEQLTADELDNRCKKHISLKVEDAKKAVCILESSLQINDFTVYPDNTIKIYDRLESCSMINKELALNNIYAEEITIKGDNLEGYFSKVIGGEQID